MAARYHHTGYETLRFCLHCPDPIRLYRLGSALYLGSYAVYADNWKRAHHLTCSFHAVLTDEFNKVTFASVTATPMSAQDRLLADIDFSQRVRELEATKTKVVLVFVVNGTSEMRGAMDTIDVALGANQMHNLENLRCKVLGRYLYVELPLAVVRKNVTEEKKRKETVLETLKQFWESMGSRKIHAPYAVDGTEDRISDADFELPNQLQRLEGPYCEFTHVLVPKESGVARPVPFLPVTPDVLDNTKLVPVELADWTKRVHEVNGVNTGTLPDLLTLALRQFAAYRRFDDSLVASIVEANQNCPLQYTVNLVALTCATNLCVEANYVTKSLSVSSADREYRLTLLPKLASKDRKWVLLSRKAHIFRSTTRSETE